MQAQELAWHSQFLLGALDEMRRGSMGMEVALMRQASQFLLTRNLESRNSHPLRGAFEPRPARVNRCLRLKLPCRQDRDLIRLLTTISSAVPHHSPLQDHLQMPRTVTAGGAGQRQTL